MGAYERNHIMKSVIFDLDGTLCDTLPDLCASMNYASQTVYKIYKNK